jgi:vitamin B12 transporter
MKYTNKKYLALPIALLLALPAWCDDNDLDTIVVTATRTEQKLSDTLGPITVLTADDIDRLQSNDMYDLLNRVPGLTVARSGGNGSVTDLFLRGTNTAQTLVLVDGIRISSATAGTTALQYLNPSQIERIEVVRGIHSSLYGSDAVGGVINIFTKKGANQTDISVTAGVGSFAARQSGMNISTGTEKSRFNLGINHYSENGFDRTEDKTFTSGDNDAYRNESINVGIGHDFTDALSTDVQYSRNKGKTEFDSDCYDAGFTQVACSPFDRFDIQTLSAKINADFSKIWNASFLAGHSSDASNNDDEIVNASVAAGSQNKFKTSRDSYTLQNNFVMDKIGTITLGLDYYNDMVNAKYDNGWQIQETSRDNKAGFVEYQTKISTQTIILGSRHDDNEQYGTKDTWSAAWGMPLTAKTDLSISYATGFNAPSFNALYWPSSDPYFVGNPNLDPEESRNVNIGLKTLEPWGSWEANVYKYDIDNLIINGPVDPLNPWGLWTALNVNNADIKGFELTAHIMLFDWNLSPNYSYVDAKDEKSDNYLPRRTQQTLQIDLDRSFGKFDTGFSWLVHSHSYNDPANLQRMGGYATLNARFAYRPIKNLSLALAVNNLLDKNYINSISSFNGDFETAGLNTLLSATYDF